METTLSTSPTTPRPARAVGFWLTTGFLAFAMTAGGLAQLLHLPFNVDGMVHPGYPTYPLYIPGTWRLAGVAELLLPGWPGNGPEPASISCSPAASFRIFS